MLRWIRNAYLVLSQCRNRCLCPSHHRTLAALVTWSLCHWLLCTTLSFQLMFCDPWNMHTNRTHTRVQLCMCNVLCTRYTLFHFTSHAKRCRVLVLLTRLRLITTIADSIPISCRFSFDLFILIVHFEQRIVCVCVRAAHTNVILLVSYTCMDGLVRAHILCYSFFNTHTVCRSLIRPRKKLLFFFIFLENIE